MARMAKIGWIDGTKKKIDEERYCHSFSPRKKRSKWSELNKERAEKMIQKKLMTEESERQ